MINDNINNLKDFYKTDGALSIVYRGEVSKKEDTYLKRLVKQDENFILISGSFVAKKWKRFGRFVLTDYFYMSETYWDAVRVTPKMDMFLLGFGLMN